MTGWFVSVAYLVAVNPPRLRPHLAVDGQRGRSAQLAGGAILVAVAGLVLVLAGERILDALEITDETWRLATGVVCILVGAQAVVVPRLGEMPPPHGAALVPIAFPLLFTPQLAVLAILFGATESFLLAWVCLIAGVGAGAAVGWLQHRRPELWLAMARTLAAVLVVIGVALVIAGIRDV